MTNILGNITSGLTGRIPAMIAIVFGTILAVRLIRRR